jgi:CheY-like chemotaxis protein
LVFDISNSDLFFHQHQRGFDLVFLHCGPFFPHSFFKALGFNPDEIYQLKTRLVLIFGILAIIALIISVLIGSVMQKLIDNAKALQTIYLPASEAKVVEEIVSDETMIQGSETILLVDDEKLILDVGKAMVSKLGYTVLVANSGKEALEMISSSGVNIDLVILDLIMPDMDGGQTFDQIRKIRSQIPVVLSSGYALDGQASEIMRRGCNGFIQKPFSLSELSKNIRRILDAT